MTRDTEKIKEVDRNQKFCDDRYVLRSWMFAGICGIIVLSSTLAFSFGQWKGSVNNTIGDYYEFKTTCETELRLFRKTASEGNTKLDTMIIIMRDMKRNGL